MKVYRLEIEWSYEQEGDQGQEIYTYSSFEQAF